MTTECYRVWTKELITGDNSVRLDDIIIAGLQALGLDKDILEETSFEDSYED